MRKPDSFNQEQGGKGETTLENGPSSGEEVLSKLNLRFPSLPEKPVVIIEPSRSWVDLRLGDLWAYRELLYFLTWRDVKVRYKQTALGAAWALLQPLFMMIIFAFAFGKLVRVPTEGVPAPLFYYVAVMPWTFFSNALASSSNSLVANSNLITKVYFPRMIIPFAAVGAGLLDFAIAFVLLLGLIPYYGMGLSWQIVMLPLLIVLTTLLASAFGMCMSALSVTYRDVRHALPFIIQLWMFATPIIYPLSLVPGKWKWVIRLNPLSGLIEGYRASLFGHPFDWLGLAVSAGLTVICFYFFGRVFRHMEKSFADVI